MSRIALVSPPFIPDYMRNARCDFVSLSHSQWYPIFLGYLGALLESRGHTVTLIDAPAYGLNREETFALVKSFKPDWLVIYTGRLSEDSDVTFSDELMERTGVNAVFVGSYASIDTAATLRKTGRVRYAVKGEFDFPTAELIEGNDPAGIANLVRKEGEEIIINPPRPLLDGATLDTFPFVTEFFSRHLDYSHYHTPSEPHPFLDLMSGRGCAWGLCTYCLWVHTFIPGRVYNARSATSVANEFAFVSKSLPHVRSLMIQDDTLTDERATELSETLLSQGNRLRWSCYARGDLSRETLNLMARAGCLNLHVGYESANKELLKNVKKGVYRERMTQFTHDAKKAGLHIHGDFAFGFPGETRETIKETIDWACEIRPHTAQFQLMIPFPGTPFYDTLAAQGHLKEGAPNFPWLPKEEIDLAARQAYRRFYISPSYLLEIVRHPYERLFSRLPTYMRAIQYLMGGTYIR